MFYDLNKMRQKYEAETGLKCELDYAFMHDLFRNGEHRVSEIELIEIASTLSDKAFSDAILNSMRSLLCGGAADEGDVVNYIIPLYRDARYFFDSNKNPERGQSLLSRIEKAARLYGNHEITSYLSGGLHWHHLAHLWLCMKLGKDAHAIEYVYDDVVEKWSKWLK